MLLDTGPRQWSHHHGHNNDSDDLLTSLSIPGLAYIILCKYFCWPSIFIEVATLAYLAVDLKFYLTKKQRLIRLFLEQFCY